MRTSSSPSFTPEIAVLHVVNPEFIDLNRNKNTDN